MCRCQGQDLWMSWFGGLSGLAPLMVNYSLSVQELAMLVSEYLRIVTIPGLHESVNRIAWRSLGLRPSDRTAASSRS